MEGVHIGTIRNIIGGLGRSFVKEASGAFVAAVALTTLPSNTQVVNGHHDLDFYASRMVPTGNKNAPRTYGALPCVYLDVPR